MLIRIRSWINGIEIDRHLSRISPKYASAPKRAEQIGLASIGWWLWNETVSGVIFAIEIFSNGRQLETFKIVSLDRPPVFGDYREMAGSIRAPEDFNPRGARPSGGLPRPQRSVSTLGEISNVSGGL